MSEALTKINEKWVWTKTKRECLERALSGWPKTTIAKELKRHRNTISQWMAHPDFKAEFNKRMGEHVASKRQQRIRETNLMADKVAKLTAQALDKALKEPTSVVTRQTAQAWASEFRAFRAEERVDFGDNITRHDHRMAVAGEVTHNHRTDQMSFRSFVEAKITKGDIDVAGIDATDVGGMISAIAQEMLVEGEALDMINEEDKADIKAVEDAQ